VVDMRRRLVARERVEVPALHHEVSHALSIDDRA
jgi:hypothetical protein